MKPYQTEVWLRLTEFAARWRYLTPQHGRATFCLFTLAVTYTLVEIPHPLQNVTAAGPHEILGFQPLLRPHMPELDTLRGIAVLGVFLLHGFFWQYGNFHFTRWQTILVNATQPDWE